MKPILVFFLNVFIHGSRAGDGRHVRDRREMCHGSPGFCGARFIFCRGREGSGCRDNNRKNNFTQRQDYASREGERSTGNPMNTIKGYELVIGAVLIISLIIGGYGVIGYSPENIFPREKICIAPYIHEGGLAGYWDTVIDKTGIDASTARLTRLKTGIRPDGAIETIDLEFLAERDGKSRLYTLWYRSDAGSCGWSDGLSYPEQSGEMPATLPANPGPVLSGLGQIRFFDLNLSGRYLVIETVTTPALTSAAAALSPDAVFFFSNGTLDSSHHPGPDTRTPFPVSLLVSEKVCTTRHTGDQQCSNTPAAWVFF
jgi:hypothetical protein